MTRGALWGSLALLPGVLTLVILLLDDGSPNYLPAMLPDTDFWHENWLAALAATFLAWTIVFLAHSLYSRRWLWSVAILIAPIPTIPLYWWFRSV